MRQHDDATDGNHIWNDLTHGERALLGALRGWKSATRAGSLGAVLHAVNGAGLPQETVLPLAALLGALELGARQTGRLFACASRRSVSLDEAMLLDAMAAAQWRLNQEAVEIMRAWFPASPACASAAAERLEDLAAALGAAGAIFPGGRSGLARPSYAFSVAAE